MASRHEPENLLALKTDNADAPVMSSKKEPAEDIPKPRAFPSRETLEHSAFLKAPERLRSLDEANLLDSDEEEAFDKAARLAARLTGAPTALFSLVDDHRQFFKAQSGFAPSSGPREETPLSHSFCQYVVSEKEPLGVDDARLHPLLADNLAISELDVVAYLGVPVKGRRGQVIGSLCTIDSVPHSWSMQDQEALLDVASFIETEIALRKHVAERQLLIDELNHRIRNLFTMVNGLIRLGRRDGITTKEFAAQLQARIEALAATHHLIQPLSAIADNTNKEITLGELVSILMAPYTCADGQRIRVGGRDISLGSDASTYLALAIHELSTNALKYGALSVTDGCLTVDWKISDESLEIIWREEGLATAPDIEPRRGFGSRLIRVCVEDRLRGTIDTGSENGTLIYTLRIPTTSLINQRVN